MKEKIKALMQRADESLEIAKLLFDRRYYDASISRSYYAMFYAAEAILLTKNLKFSSHKGVISLFGQYFVKTGVFPQELGRSLNRAYDERLTGDYSFESVITRKDAQNTLTTAKNFISQIKEYLTKEGYAL